MKKRIFLLALVLAPFILQAQTTVDRAMSVWARNIVNDNFTTAFANTALRATIASPSFTGGISLTSTVREYTTMVTIDSTQIVGDVAGDLNHADGHVLVATAGTGFALEFVSAFIIYDHAIADFTGGGDDLVIQVGVNSAQVAMSSAISQATLLTGSGDAMIRVSAIATETVYSDAGIISLYAGTKITNPGTAEGLMRVHVTYRVHTTGL